MAAQQKTSLEKLKDVLKALDFLEGTEAKISVKVPVTEEVREFLNHLRNEDHRISYVSEDYYYIVVTIETKHCRFTCEDQF